MDKFKVRCSSLGKVCAKKGFGVSGQSEVKVQLSDIVYNRHTKISSRYLDKGNICEPESVLMLNDILGLNVEKNDQQFENDFIRGTPDYIIENQKVTIVKNVFLKEKVTDIKNSFIHTTFPLFETEPEYIYQWQIKGYMWLLGITKGSVDYFLNDMPDELITRLAWQKLNKLGQTELDEDFYNEFAKDYIYSHLPLKLRYKSFDVTLSDKDIDFIKTNVSFAQEYAENLINQYKNN